MLFKILRRILGRHLKLHLLIPLIVALWLEYFSAVYFAGRVIGWREFFLRAALTALVVLLTYIVIMTGLIKKETSITVSKLDLAILKDSVKDAQSLFATSTIPFREWFDPVSQVYFSIIMNRHFQNTAFRHERVFLFFREAALKNLESMYLDGYYSKCLAEMQENYSIPAAFLRRDKIFEVLNNLSDDDKGALGCYRIWLPGLSRNHARMSFRKVFVSGWRLRHGSLDFAFIALSSGGEYVLRVSKHGQGVRIERIEESNQLSPYKNFVTQTRRIIYKNGITPPQIRPECSFSNLSPSI